MYHYQQRLLYKISNLNPILFINPSINVCLPKRNGALCCAAIYDDWFLKNLNNNVVPKQYRNQNLNYNTKDDGQDDGQNDGQNDGENDT